MGTTDSLISCVALTLSNSQPTWALPHFLEAITASLQQKSSRNGASLGESPTQQLLLPPSETRTPLPEALCGRWRDGPVAWAGWSSCSLSGGRALLPGVGAGGQIATVARLRRHDPLEVPPQVIARIDPAPQAAAYARISHFRHKPIAQCTHNQKGRDHRLTKSISLGPHPQSCMQARTALQRNDDLKHRAEDSFPP